MAPGRAVGVGAGRVSTTWMVPDMLGWWNWQRKAMALVSLKVTGWVLRVWPPEIVTSIPKAAAVNVWLTSSLATVKRTVSPFLMKTGSDVPGLKRASLAASFISLTWVTVVAVGGGGRGVAVGVGVARGNGVEVGVGVGGTVAGVGDGGGAGVRVGARDGIAVGNGVEAGVEVGMGVEVGRA